MSSYFHPTHLYHPICSIFIIVALLCTSCKEHSSKKQEPVPEAVHFYDFPDVLDLTGLPDSTADRSVHIFADQGAWFGYALPGAQLPHLAGSFSGPFLMTQDNGCWLSPVLSQFELVDVQSGKVIDLSKTAIAYSHFFPGRLRQGFSIRNPHLNITVDLVFANARTALQQIRIESPVDQSDITLQLRWKGNHFLQNDVAFSEDERGIRINFANNNIGLIAPLSFGDFQKTVQDDQYQLTSEHKTLTGNNPWDLYLAHTFCFSEGELTNQTTLLTEIANDPQAIFEANEKKWDALLNKVLYRLPASYSSIEDKRVAVKCLQTLTTNWRSAAGFLQHDGLFPSYHYEWFHGFWSWDSWKHAVAIAHFDPELAQNQIRAMYDFQDEMGMIADCVYRDTVIESHNWRDTKPPLSAWAIWEVYQQSQDLDFLKELFPKVEKYHQWWYQYRDHDQNGLCEYGSTDGSLVAAKWESGMDNAVRFDETHLLPNNEYGWSMNRESVDLNAYLFAEKNYLAQIAERLGQSAKTKKYSSEAKALKTQIQTVFYDEESGWFYDIDLNTKEHFKAFGAEGWIPLWAQAASKKQASRLLETMLDTSKFATYIPFPTLAADHPNFDPNGSYWRGPVWMDQAYFAIKGLRNYGYLAEADQFTHQLLNRLGGLKDSDAPIRENYHPLTGEGLESSHFSWSAAHLLLLMWEE